MVKTEPIMIYAKINCLMDMCIRMSRKFDKFMQRFCGQVRAARYCNRVTLVLYVLLAGMSISLVACGSGGTSQTAQTTPIAPTITQQPSNQTVSAGQPATFSVNATGTGPLTFTWFMNGTANGGNSDAYTISVTSLAENGADLCNGDQRGR
jgi:hypothetical protein